MLDGEGLFEANTTWIALRRGQYLRDFALCFIEYCSPALNGAVVRDKVYPKGTA